MVAKFFWHFCFVFNTFSQKMCTHFLNLVFCAWLFVCLSVRQCLCKSPTSGGQTKFRSKVLWPVLVNYDTILEIFNFNDLIFSVFFESLKLLSLGQKIHQKAHLKKKKFFFMLVRLSVRAWEPNGWPFCSAEYKTIICWAKLVNFAHTYLLNLPK